MLVILLPFAQAYQYHVPFGNGEWYTVYDSLLQGKWRVDRQEINGLSVPEGAWATDTTLTIWSTMYFQGRDCFVNSHPCYYAPKTGQRADYSYDAGKKVLEIKLRGQEGAIFKGTVASLQGDKMAVKGNYENRKMMLALTRVKTKSKA